MDVEATRAGTITRRHTPPDHLEYAPSIQDEATLKGIRTREGDGRADDVDARIVTARDIRSKVEDITASAQAEEASDARRVITRVDHVAHPRTEAHAREVEARSGKVHVRRGGRGRNSHGTGTGGIDEAIELTQRVRGIGHNSAALGDDQEAAGFITVEGGRIQRAVRGNGDRATINGERSREGIHARESQRTEAILDQAAGGVRRIERTDRDHGTRATPTGEGDARDGARHVGPWAGDDDTGHLTAINDCITGSGRAPGHEPGRAKGHQRSADIAAPTREPEIGLRDAIARGGREARKGDGKTVGVDGDNAVSGSRTRDRRVINRTV